MRTQTSEFKLENSPGGLAGRLRAIFLSPLPTRDVALYCLQVIAWGSVACYLGVRWVFGLLPVSMLYSSGTTELDLINRYCPYRLVQPEWLGVPPDGLTLIMNWSLAESAARFAVLGIATLSLAWFSHKAIRRLIR